MADKDVENAAEEPRDNDAREFEDEAEDQTPAQDLTGSEPEQTAQLRYRDDEDETADEPLAAADAAAPDESEEDEDEDPDFEDEEDEAESDEEDADGTEVEAEAAEAAAAEEEEEASDPEQAASEQDSHEETEVAAVEGSVESDSEEADADDPSPAARGDEDADADTDTLEAPEGIGQPEVTTERVIEAVLFASDAPLPLSKIVSILGVGSARDVRNHIKALNEKYAQTGASFRIEQIASGYQMLTMPVYNNWIRRLKQSKQDSRLSQAAMETLAVVAYKQPVIRADIEAIRGVSAGEMLNRLREVGLIKIVGRAEDVGRPMLYGTTKRFLEVFGLSGLEDLPPVEELQPGQQ